MKPVSIDPVILVGMISHRRMRLEQNTTLAGSGFPVQNFEEFKVSQSIEITECLVSRLEGAS